MKSPALLHPQGHQDLFAQHGVVDACGIQEAPRRVNVRMQAAGEPSTAVIAGLSRSDLHVVKQSAAGFRSILLKALHAEHDAEFFCQELDRRVAAGKLQLTPEFRAFEHAWRRDELDHTLGYAKVISLLYGDDEAELLAHSRARQPKFERLEPLLADEFSICLLLAYDEMVTAGSYRADGRTFYPQFRNERLLQWIKRLAADEERHSANLLAVLRQCHQAELHRTESVLTQIARIDVVGAEYAATFVLDHDEASVFTERQLAAARRRLLRRLVVGGER